MIEFVVKDFLERKFLEWQSEEGERKTLSEFADYLGISISVLSNYLGNRRVPDDENTALIAAKLGQEIYDILGKPRPDPLLWEIIKGWGSATEETRKEFVKEFLESLRGAANETDTKSVGQSKRKGKKTPIP